MPYIGTSPSNGVRRVHTYTATASQTTFSGASSEGVTLSYVDTNYLDVYQNGILLGSADYTATSGTSVVLTQAASASDLVVIVVYDVFSVADTVSKSSGGTFDSGITMSSTLDVTGNSTVGGTLGVTGATTLTGDLAVDTNVLKVDTTNNKVGINITSPTNRLHTHQTTSGGNFIQVTNSTTGTTSSDGFIIGIDSGENANLWNYENEDMVFATNNTERIRIESNGETGINESSPTAQLHVTSPNLLGTRDALKLQNLTNSSFGGYFIRFVNHSGGTNGYISQDNNTNISLVDGSDYRLKENVLYDFDATSRLKKLKPCRFNFIEDPQKTIDGFLAHEVSDAVPNAVFGQHNEVEVWQNGEELPDGVSVGDNKIDEDGNTIPVYQGIDQSKLVPLLVKTIQELEARITALENAE